MIKERLFLASVASILYIAAVLFVGLLVGYAMTSGVEYQFTFIERLEVSIIVGGSFFGFLVGIGKVIDIFIMAWNFPNDQPTQKEAGD